MTPTQIIIPSDSPSIYDALSVLDKQAIVRPNNPPPGIAGFLFDIPGDEELRLRTAITQHYLEDNTPVQDMAALQPEEIKLRGLIAELSTGLPSLPAPVPVPNTLPLNPVIIPTPSAGQAQAAASAGAAETAAQSAALSTQTAYSYQQSISPQQPNQTRQSNALGYFYQLWKGRMTFSVETPFGIMNNMMITDAHVVQEADSREKSNFTIVFQKIRTVGAAIVQSGQLSGRRALQASPTTQNGVAGQQPVSDAQAAQLYQSFA